MLTVQTEITVRFLMKSGNSFDFPCQDIEATHSGGKLTNITVDGLREWQPHPMLGSFDIEQIEGICLVKRRLLIGKTLWFWFKALFGLKQ